MYRQRMRCIGMIAVLCLVFLVGNAWAEDIKARMKSRLPAIVKLKQQGIVGEDNRGYLAFVTARKVNADLVAAENSDRKKVYNLIARQQGVSLEKVESLRALQIEKKSPPGVFLQKPDGTWYKK